MFVFKSIYLKSKIRKFCIPMITTLESIKKNKVKLKFFPVVLLTHTDVLNSCKADIPGII